MSESASILVVDDEPRWLESLSRILISAGYVVRPAGSGEAALAAVTETLPDLILLDIRMPGMGGFEVIRRLKEQDQSRNIPILLLSSFAEVDERTEGLKLGAVDSVTKPFHAGELLARVRMQAELARLQARHSLHAEEMNATNKKLQDEIAQRQRVEEALKSRLVALTLPLDDPEGIRFSDLFEIENIQRLQDQFSQATGVASIITAPDGTPITKPSNFCRLCRLIRKTELGRCNCYESDAVLGIPRASGPTIQPCLSGGLWDAGASITVGGKHIANWLIGQVRNDAQSEEEMLEYADKIGADREVFREALAEVPIMSGEQFAKTAELLFSFASELSARAFQNVQQARFITGNQMAVETLRRREHDYRLLFEGMLEGFALHEIICDESGKPVDYRFLSINPAFEKITGLCAADTVGRTVREIMPKIEEVWIERYGRVALTGEPVHFENHSASLGRDFQATAYRPQEGQFAVVFEDITERKAAEARVARLSQLYFALSQCNQAIVHSTSVEELLPRICRAVVEFGGMKMAWIGLVDEAAGRVHPAAYFGEGREYLVDLSLSLDPREPTGSGPTATAIREGRPVWCQNFPDDPMTAPWHERGAHYGWKSLASLPLRRGGKIVGALLVYSDKANVFDGDVSFLLEEMADDISFAFDSFVNEAERQRMEQALSESEETMRLIVKHDPNSLAVFDSGMRYIAVSDRFLQDNNVNTDIIGKHHYEVFPEIPQKWRDVHQRCLAGAVEKKDDDRFVRPDGLIAFNRWECRPWYRAGGAIGGIILYSEVTTERKMAEEALVQLNHYLADATARAEELAVKAESAARAKSEFLALMSHELRTPLNGVLGFAELLSGTRLDEEQQEFTKTILDSGNHLLDVVNDILDFSSIEKGRMQIDEARISIATLLEATCRPIRKLASDKEIELHCVKAGDVPDEITGDARRIRQILLNLLGNAVKFTEEGSVVLGITMSSDDGRPVLEFSVEDTGPGIPRDTLGRLFKPFTQADSTVSRRFAGTGLGLAISLRLAEAMGGALDVESTPGQGSKFTFRLPLDAGEPGAAAPAPALQETNQPNKKRAPGETPARNFHSVLVVEDDFSNRILAGKMLAHLGYQTAVACNGQEALDVYEPSRFSAILMDMQMPLLDGLEATRRIRQIESGTRVPIIALTANVMPGDRERCLEAGMDEFLTKPFKLKDLADKLAIFLQP